MQYHKLKTTEKSGINNCKNKEPLQITLINFQISLNKYVVIRTRIPAGSNLKEATNSGPALDTKGVIAAIEVPQSAKGSIIKNQFRIEFIRSADNLFKVVLCIYLKNDLAFRRKSKRMARIVIDEPITSSTRVSVLKALKQIEDREFPALIVRIDSPGVPLGIAKKYILPLKDSKIKDVKSLLVLGTYQHLEAFILVLHLTK